MKDGSMTLTAPATPDLLYLVHRVPYPPDKGDRIRAYHVLRKLTQFARVHLACLADEPVPEETRSVLANLCARLAIQPLAGGWRKLRMLAALASGRTVTEGAFESPRLRAVVQEWARTTPFAAAVASASSMVPYLRLPGLAKVAAVVDLVDVDSEKWLDYAAESRGPAAWLYRLEAHRLRRLEQDLPRWARAVTLVSEAEADLYRRFCASGRVEAISNGVDLEYFHPRQVPAEQGLVFTGALDYRPNIDGVCWFCQEIWPKVRAACPDLIVSLIGRNPVRAVQRLGCLPGVEVVGPVPDVRPHVAAAAAVIAPLRIARGIQNKVLEALAMAKAVIVSPQALEGLQARPGIHLLSAVSPAEWIDAIHNLLSNAARRQALGREGRRYVEEQHSWDQRLQPFEALLVPESAALV
jgi:sugar transferase (PEP-CTERM/EpsH1 system associated)